MPRKKPTAKPAELRLSPPELWRLEFTRNELDGEFSATEHPPLIFGLGLNRISATRLGVELSVELKDFPPLSVMVAYRAVFDVESSGSPEELERDLRYVAAHIGPSALYPYVREAMSSAIVRAGLPPLVPPIVNFRNVFSADEVNLPNLPAEAPSRHS